MSDKITASVVLEVLGKPKDYLEKALKEHVDRLGSERGAKVIKKTFHEPKKISGDEKNEKTEIYTTFVDLEVELDDFDALFMMIFSYPPAHIEITSPGNFKLQISEFNLLLNEIIRKIHQYDDIAKAFILEKEAMQNFIKKISEEKNQLKQELSNLKSGNKNSDKEKKGIKK